ncbi:MAG: SDR family NAD(P)-dependent oxidoreductase [Planctomycetaceae bacterium]
MAARNAIIIGASSGIGEALAKDLALRGYSLGVAARRVEQLHTLASTLPTRCVIRAIDVSDTESAIHELEGLVAELGDVELFVISAGTGHLNPELDWEKERVTLATNVMGFAAMANVAIAHLTVRGGGQLVGISSIAAIRGHGTAPAYGASKAFVSSYLAALRHRFAKSRLPINVLEVQPGFVDTAMAQGDGLFWVAPVAKASSQILTAIDRKRSHVYVTRRWRFIAWVLLLLPEAIYNRI